jgi:hypothetical protein
MLLRHCATNLNRLFLPRIWIVDPQRERAVTPCQTFNDPRAALARRRGLFANIDVAIAHDQNPFEVHRNAQLLGKVADRSIEPAGAVLRVTVGEFPSRFSTRERLKIRSVRRTSRSWPARVRVVKQRRAITIIIRHLRAQSLLQA